MTQPNLRLLITMCLAIAFCTMGSAQNNQIESDTFYRSIGIDANFINNFLPIENPIGSQGRYLFHFIKTKPNNKFTRHAFDIDILGSFENNESDTDVDDTRLVLDYKIGKGKRKYLFKRSSLLYGGEARMSYFYNQRVTFDENDPNEESFNTLRDQIFTISAGPFVGFEFKLSKRFSLYTETGFYLHYSYGIDVFKSDLDPDLDFKDTRNNIEERFVLPSSIILFYSF